MNGTRANPQPISIVVTTYGTDTYYTQACLESVRRWKRPHHELIVVTHDESPLLRAYLDACEADGLITRLVFAVPGHGHTRGFNLGFQHATSDLVFHIANDMLIGPAIVDDCARQLRETQQLGIIGWHWYGEGAVWCDGKLAGYLLADKAHPQLPEPNERAVRNAPWFTGRTFEALGGPLRLHLCNTSFFGMRREVLERVGEGFAADFPHYWADDFLCYAVLDQGLDVRQFDTRFRHPPFFRQFDYDNLDVPDRRRHQDMLRWSDSIFDAVAPIGGGMSPEELGFLHTLAKAIPNGSTVTAVGVWRGSSAMVLLDALRNKHIRFHFIDWFDIPGTSAASAQPPVTPEEFIGNISPFVSPEHSVNIVKAKSLDLQRFPRSHFVFIDGGHTGEWIAHDTRLGLDCLLDRSVLAFHDYGCPFWPDVKPEIDRVLPNTTAFQTVAVYRNDSRRREAFQWPHERRHGS